MNATSGANDELRFDRRRVTPPFAPDTRHLEGTQANQRQNIAQHDSSNARCLCPTCHLKTARFPRRHDGRILLPPPAPLHEGKNASSASIPYINTQTEQLTGSDEHRGVVDGDGSASVPRTAPAATRRGKGRCSPARLVTPTTTVSSDEREKTSLKKTNRASGSTVRSHAAEPYPLGLQPKPQRYGGLKQGRDPQSSARRSSNSNITNQIAASSTDAARLHERQPFSQVLEPLPYFGTASILPRSNISSELSLERHGPALHTTSPTIVSSYHDAFYPTGPTLGSSSRYEAVAATSRPSSPPTERPPSRFFRFRPELFDQYVEVSADHDVSIETTHSSYQDPCDTAQSGESSTGPWTDAAMPDPFASQGARSPQPLSHIAHSKGVDALSERIDIGALALEKAATPPQQPATAKAASSSSRPRKRNRSSDKDASSSSVQVKWDSERKRRQGYFAQDDGNEKSPFRHYNQTSCNFDP